MRRPDGGAGKRLEDKKRRRIILRNSQKGSRRIEHKQLVITSQELTEVEQVTNGT